MKNALEHREGDILIKFRARKARICYVCRSYIAETNYCKEFKKEIKEAKEALSCEGYNCIFNGQKVKCQDCINFKYNYYCDALNGSAPYPTKTKECSGFNSKK